MSTATTKKHITEFLKKIHEKDFHGAKASLTTVVEEKLKQKIKESSNSTEKSVQE